MVIHVPGRGMEQFHHPRPVLKGRAPTPQRQTLTRGLRGRVLEVGAGDGVKLTCYPAEVGEIVLVEPDTYLRGTARLAAAGVAAAVRVLAGDPARLPVEDASCDAVVCSLVLCCAPRLDPALAEVRRALRPGGELRFYEHQRSGNPLVAGAEAALTPLWSRVCGGCHLNRDVVGAIGRAGFALGQVEVVSLWHTTHVLGTARRTSD